MTPRFTCATRRPGNQQAPGLALTQTDAAPPLRAAARCSTAPGDWQTAGRRTWGGAVPGSPRRSRGSGSASRPQSTRWSARAAWCTARTCPAPPPARGARAGHHPAASTEKAFRARPPGAHPARRARACADTVWQAARHAWGAQRPTLPACAQAVIPALALQRPRRQPVGADAPAAGRRRSTRRTAWRCCPR